MRSSKANSNTRLKGTSVQQEGLVGAVKQSKDSSKQQSRIRQQQEQDEQEQLKQQNQNTEGNLNDSFQRLVEYKINELVEENARLLDLVSDKQGEIEALKRSQRMQFQDIMEKVNATEAFISTQQIEIQSLKDERNQFSEQLEIAENSLSEERERASTYLLNFETIDRQVQQVITENAYLNSEIEQKQILLDQQTSNLEKATLLINQLNSALEMQSEKLYVQAAQRTHITEDKILNNQPEKNSEENKSSGSQQGDEDFKDEQEDISIIQQHNSNQVYKIEKDLEQGIHIDNEEEEDSQIEQQQNSQIIQEQLLVIIEQLKMENNQLQLEIQNKGEMIDNLEIETQSIKQELIAYQEKDQQSQKMDDEQSKEKLVLKKQINDLQIQLLNTKEIYAKGSEMNQKSSKLLQEMRRTVVELEKQKVEFMETLTSRNQQIEDLNFSLAEVNLAQQNSQRLAKLKDEELEFKESLLQGQILSFNNLQKSLNNVIQQNLVS